MRIIKLTQNKITVVDDEDFEYLNTFKWKYNKTGYAVRNQWLKDEKRYISVRMHRLIMNNPVGVVDHINGDTLDNRRSNLRVCKHRQNIQNQKLRIDSKSGLKGVYWHNQNRRWYARFNRKSLGSYETKELAARAYDSEAIKKYGKFARLNNVT